MGSLMTRGQNPSSEFPEKAIIETSITYEIDFKCKQFEDEIVHGRSGSGYST